MACIATVAIGSLWALPRTDPTALVRVPDDVKADITRIAEMQDPPSGRLWIEVEGDTVFGVLNAQAKLRPVLTQAQDEGALTKWHMLQDLVPFKPIQSLPTPAELSVSLPAALSNAGLAPSFATEIQKAYSTAHAKAAQPSAIPHDLVNTTGLATLLSVREDHLIGIVHLWDIEDTDALATAIAQMDNPNIHLIDQQALIFEQLDALTKTVLHSLGIGAVLGLIFLAFFRRDALQIAIATAAATASTALLVSLVTGSLGVFQIVALVLVTGIGIDYGLFLRNDTEDEAFKAAASSVTRCVITTLIAFTVMAFSGVTVLQNIGMTVSIGVLAMLVMHLLRENKAGQT